MKVRTRAAACISAAVAALLWGGGADARDLTWDANGAADPLTADGDGGWDTATPNWVDPLLNPPGTNVTWSNAPADSAFFGNTTNTFSGAVSPHLIDISEAITVQNIDIGVAGNGASFTIGDFSGGSLTVQGNITKSSPGGTNLNATGLQMVLSNNGLNLTSGAHVFAINDTPNDFAPDLSILGEVKGDGGITVNNGAFATWGTLALRSENSYTGATSIEEGRLIITTASGLGATSAGTTISNLGTLAIGGANIAVPVGGFNLNIAEPITVTRNTYSGPDNTYSYAIFSANGTGSHTFSGPFAVESNDARLRVETSTVTISSNITSSSGGTLTVDGDFAGQVNLTGNNAGLATGGVRLIGGVQLNVENHDNLGGAAAPISFSGSATLHPIGGFMTSFGAHPINAASFSGGINVDENHSFTIDIPLGPALGDATNPVGNIGKRGLGTLNLTSPINLRGGSTFWDAGVVNVTAAVELQSLHLRSSVVNIGVGATGGSVTAVGNTSSFGESSNGTNGGPDKATVNINNGGSFTQQATGDFFVSDGANTEGTINLKPGGTLTANGLVHVARNAGGKGTINQTGGHFQLNRDGNFTFVLGSRNGEGTYNLSGGTMTSEGEFYVGQGGSGKGFFNMSGGTVNLDHWFVVGREGGQGTVDFSGGVFNKTRGGTHTEVDVGGGVGPSTMTMRNDALYNAVNGDIRVGVGGGGNGTLTLRDSAVLSVGGGEIFVGQGTGTGVLTVQDDASITVNNWFAIGREGGNGTVNLSGTAEITKGGGAGSRIVIGAPVNRNDAVGVLNQTGGILTNTVSETWINEAAASGTWNFSAGTANLADLHVGQAGGAASSATLNLSGTAALNANVVRLNVGGAIVSTINLDGGTLKANQVIAGGGSDAKNLNLNGGLLQAGATNTTDWMTGAISANVKADGAKLDSNGFDIRVNTPLVHDAALGATPDGGLTKSGSGTATLAGANTYTGPTNVNAGALVLANSLTTSSAVNANSALLQLASDGSANRVIKTPAVSATGTGKIDLTDNKLIVTTAGQSGTFTAGAYTGIAGEVDRARGSAGNALWDGPSGITTSDTRAIDNGDLISIGVATVAEARNLTAADTTTFAGQTVLGSDTLAMVTWGGDANLDGKINIDDYGQIDSNVSKSGSVFGWNKGDFNYDGKINIDDYGIIDGNIGRQTGTIPTAGGVELAGGSALDGVAAVPEPASLSLVALGAMGLMRRRRRSGRHAN